MPRAPKKTAAAKKPQPGDVETLLYDDGRTAEVKPSEA